MNGLGALTGSLISYGCGQIHYKSYPVWSWIYLWVFTASRQNVEGQSELTLSFLIAFRFTGCLTVLWGVVLLFILPSSPMVSFPFPFLRRLLASTDFQLLHPQTAWFLTPDERVIAIERLKSNQTSLGSSKVNWSQVREVFDPRIDPQGWLLFIWITANEVVK